MFVKSLELKALCLVNEHCHFFQKIIYFISSIIGMKTNPYGTINAEPFNEWLCAEMATYPTIMSC